VIYNSFQFFDMSISAIHSFMCFSGVWFILFYFIKYKMTTNLDVHTSLLQLHFPDNVRCKRIKDVSLAKYV